MKTRSTLMALAIWALAAFLAGCQSSTNTEQTETQGAAKTEAKRTASAHKTPRVQKLTVPAGTALDVRLVDGIDTGKANEGDTFEGTVAASLLVNGINVAPVGSTVTGKVTSVVSSGRLSRPAELSLVLTSLTPKGGEKTEISTQTWSVKGQSHKKRDIEMIGGGGGAGALIGALAGGKKGAAIGAAVGAGAGTGVAAATGKKEIVLPPETKLTFTLNAPFTLSFGKNG